MFHPQSSRSLLSLDTNPIYELSAQILLAAIKQARSNHGFGLLSRTSQNTIFAHLWAPLFLLRAAHWSSPEHLIFLPELHTTIASIQHLHLDLYELELLVNVLLCRKDLLEDIDQSRLAEGVLFRTLDALAIRTGLDRRRFAAIILSLPILFQPSGDYLYSKLFKPAIGSIPIETVIGTIY